MNKKGFISPGSFVSIFIITIVIVTLAAIQETGDIKYADEAINKLNWSKYQENITKSIDVIINEPGQQEYVKTLMGVVKKGIDFVGYTTIEITKLAIQVVKEHPDLINYKNLSILVLISLIAPLLYPIFIITVSLILITREWYISRKEKKILEERKKELKK